MTISTFLYTQYNVFVSDNPLLCHLLITVRRFKRVIDSDDIVAEFLEVGFIVHAIKLRNLNVRWKE